MPELLSPATARRVARRWPWISGGTAILAVLLIGAIITFRQGSVEFDAEWMEEIIEHRHPAWEVPSRVMDFLGGGWFGIFVVPIGAAIALLVGRKRWSALYFVLASAVSAGTVQLLKRLFGRARPEDILLPLDSASFPSGHVANAATVAVVLGLLLTRLWVWLAGVAWVVLMLLSRTYLGAHWLSDTIGGVLLGAAVALIVWAPFAEKLEQEWRRASSPVGSVAP
jgi:membrane-associated phospholipid phosphatase